MDTPAKATKPEPRVSLGLLWFGLFGAGAAWSLQELVGYAVLSHACYPDWYPRYGFAASGPWTAALAVSVLAVVLSVAAGATAWHTWRRAASSDASALHTLHVAEGRVRFMALSGLVVSGMLLFAVVMNLVALFLVPACG